MNIETNTQELKEVLDMVYNLPNASGGGSAKADLVITGMPRTEPVTEDFFAFYRGTANGKSCGPQYVTFEQEQVVSAFEKLINGNEVRGALKLPATFFNSWDGFYAAAYPAARVAAKQSSPNRLHVRFECASTALSVKGSYVTIEYIFTVNVANRTAVLSDSILWDE